MLHVFNIAMSARDSLTIEGTTANAHRGVWFYDPSIRPAPVATGDIVEWLCNDSPVAIGVVVEHGLLPRDFPSFCSQVNPKGFRWEPFDPDCT